MIGNQQLTFTRYYTYLLSTTTNGTNKTPVTTPPARGCYVRVEGGRTGASVIVYGTSGGSTTTETITTYDSDGVGFGTKLWTAITKFDVAGFSGTCVVYPATEAGEKRILDTSTSVVIMASMYITNESPLSGFSIVEFGKHHKNFRDVIFDRRFMLYEDDKITIDNKEYVVLSVDSLDSNRYKAIIGIRKV